MNSLTDLIGNADFILLLLYAIAGWFFMRFIVFKGQPKRFYAILLGFFVLKLIGTVTNNLLIIYYWKIGDALSFFQEAKNLSNMIINNVSNISYLVLPVTEYNNAIKLDNILSGTSSGAGLETNYFVTRFCTLLFPLSLGKFLLVNFWFCFISTIAQAKLYIVLAKRYPEIKKYLGICVLFLPTLLLYASPIFKETLCLSFICFALSCLYQISKRHNIVYNSLWLLINMAMILIVKSYVIYALLLAAGVVLIFKAIFFYYRRSILGKLITLFILILSIVVFVLNAELLDPYIASFADMSNFFQQQYNGDFGESSSFELGEMEISTVGFFKKAPVAAYTTYFRPHLWEVRKPIMLLSAIESFSIALLTLIALVKNGIHLRSLLKNDLPLTLAITYLIVFGIIVGLTTFNFGTLVRYKVPGLPFLWIFTLLLLNYKPKQTTAI